jgi:hypothetical protein
VKKVWWALASAAAALLALAAGLVSLARARAEA